MKNITANSPGTAWKKMIKEVIHFGSVVFDDGVKLTESLNITIKVKNPTKIDKIVKNHSNKSMIDWMQNNFFSQTPIDNWGYSYGQRIFNFKGENQIELALFQLFPNLFLFDNFFRIACNIFYLYSAISHVYQHASYENIQRVTGA